MAGIISLFAQIIGLVFNVAQTPLVNPSWVEGVIPFLGQVPIVGPYLEKIPILIWAVVIGFMLIWCLGYVILGAIGGSMGLIVALIAGALIVMFLYGGIAFNIPQVGG